MRTFTGNYIGRNFVYSDDTEAIRSQLISILNTPIGSRFYYPSYGSHLNEFRFSVLNYYTINMIGQEIKNAIGLIDGVKLSSISYSILDDNNLYFNIGLIRLQSNININVSVSNGIAS